MSADKDSGAQCPYNKIDKCGEVDKRVLCL